MSHGQGPPKKIGSRVQFFFPRIGLLVCREHWSKCISCCLPSMSALLPWPPWKGQWMRLVRCGLLVVLVRVLCVFVYVRVWPASCFVVLAPTFVCWCLFLRPVASFWRFVIAIVLHTLCCSFPRLLVRCTVEHKKTVARVRILMLPDFTNLMKNFQRWDLREIRVL